MTKAVEGVCHIAVATDLSSGKDDGGECTLRKSSGIRLKQMGFWVAWAQANTMRVASSSPNPFTCNGRVRISVL